MGLDMFLFRKQNGEMKEIGYWRKANAIHAWFVNECQNGVDECQRSRVPKSKLRTLLVKIHDILCHAEADLDWQTLAENTLPSQSGFFFGGTEYDEYYLQDLRQTVDIVKRALAEPGTLYYQSSW